MQFANLNKKIIITLTYYDQFQHCVFIQETLQLDENVTQFLDEVAEQLHIYIQNHNFKNSILQKVATSWRLKLGLDINAQIEMETKVWEETHVNQIYKDMIAKNLNDKLKTICEPLAENLMKGFKMPYDPDNTILKGILQTSVSIVGGFAIRAVLFEPPVAVGLAATGVFFTALVNFGYINDFNTVCEKAVNVRINKLSKRKIRHKLDERYATSIKQNVEEALDKLRDKLQKLREVQKERETENTTNTSRMRIFVSLDDMVSKCRQRLQKIEDLCAQPTIDKYFKKRKNIIS